MRRGSFIATISCRSSVENVRSDVNTSSCVDGYSPSDRIRQYLYLRASLFVLDQIKRFERIAMGENSEQSQAQSRDEKIADFSWNLMKDAALGTGPSALTYSVRILADSDCALLVRWSAKEYGDSINWLEAGGRTWPIPLVFIDECTMRFEWATRDDRESLSENLTNWEMVESDEDVWKVLDFDSPGLTDHELEIVLGSIDCSVLGDDLLDWETAADRVDYDLFPRRLKPFLISCVAEARKRAKQSPPTR